MSLTRRRMIQTTGLALGAAALTRPLSAQEGGRKKVLFFTKSSGFQHSVITRKGDEPAHAERILTEIGQEHGYDVTASKDGRLFEPDQIGEWDAFAFYTTGILTESATDGQPPMSPEGLQAFFDAIKGGKGFIGMHCATDTFHSGKDEPSEYTKMIGGEFLGHGAQQEVPIDVVDESFPGAGAFGSEFRINDEWYSLKNIADDLHVIMVQLTEGMQGRDYQRPNYPMTWIKKYGEGNVFYTSMGHREDVWTNEKYQGLLIGGLDVVTGKKTAEHNPDVESVTPGYKELPR